MLAGHWTQPEVYREQLSTSTIPASDVLGYFILLVLQGPFRI
jgi:hypothetical protein